MNTTMAPTLEIRRNNLASLERRQRFAYELGLRKRDEFEGVRDGGSESGDDSDREGERQGQRPTDSAQNRGSPPQSPQSPITPFLRPLPATSSFVEIATPATVVTVPSTASITPMPTPPQTTSTSTSVTPEATSTSAKASFFATISPTTTEFPRTTIFASSLQPSSSQGRKGLNTDDHEPPSPSPTAEFTTSTTDYKTTTTVVPTAQLETAAASSTSGAYPFPSEISHRRHGELSPTAEHVLIAAGTLGAVIIFAAAMYLFMRMKNQDMFAAFRKKPGNSLGFLSRRDSTDRSYNGDDVPPPYATDEKRTTRQRHLDGFFAPFQVPAPAAMAREKEPLPEEEYRSGLIDNSAPMGLAPAPDRSFLQAPSQTYYNFERPGDLQRQASSATQNTAQAYYGGGGTYDPNQRNQKYLSSLSSLSSGFGDQIIIPEPTTGEPQIVRTSRQTYRQSTSSWTQPPPAIGQRDTMYTATSIESAPRYRTVNSWVNQQSDRVERRQEIAAEVPNMPVIPAALASRHQRNFSEDPAFRAHPGEEVSILDKGTRVPSRILDKKIGYN
ncbi:hypothetical protein PVAG01_04626 [Phlyctema vagabunda]|uniref:Uncharacterized protein n=1 Tax=Phlyctema vagabunda TaxID=108571 RepID=A0ABR4PHV3_9HELO